MWSKCIAAAGHDRIPGSHEGLTLVAESSAGRQELVYSCAAHTLRLDAAASVSAMLPAVQCRVSIEAGDGEQHAEAREGFMFQLFYTLSLARKVSVGESLKTRLTLKAL